MPLLMLLLVAAVSAQKIALSPSPATFTLVSGVSRTVQFRLNAPIICNDLTVECSVVVKITNGDTSAVSLDTCLVKWKSNEWSEVRTVTISPRPSFVDDSQRTIILTTSPANSTAVYYSGFKPADITLQTARRKSSQCSATGDPHYTSFDGHYWHFYEVAQNVVYRSVAVGRVFEIQARLWIPPYSRHCGLAGREDNDLVIVDFCTGSANIVTRFSSPPGLTPRITVSGNSYTVFFKSGATMRADWGGWGMNVYFTAPGQDYNKTVGMCGNNNGNPLDDTAGPQTPGKNNVFWYARDLLPDQRMNGRADLWSWYPPPPTTTVTLPPYAQECPTQDTPIIPILNNPGGVDITDNLKNDNNENTASTAAPFIINTQAPTAAPVQVSEADANRLCNSTIRNSSLVRTCNALFLQNNDPDWIERFVSGCVQDIVLIGYDPAWIASAMQGIQNECALLATQFNRTITNTFCPTRTTQPCSGNGVCTNNVCVCNSPFAGVDCGIDTRLPPVLTVLAASTCDVLGIHSCPDQTIAIQGSGFFRSSNLTCRFNNTLMPALYMGASEVLCNFPTFNLGARQQANLYVQVSNDLVSWSNPAPITYYNSNCVICTQANSCSPNLDSCNINGACYANLDVSFDNPCLFCNKTRNTTSWSYTYESAACWPDFDFPLYSFKVVGVVPANTVLGTVRAINPFLVADKGYSLTYSLNTTFTGVFPFRISADPSNPNIAVISTSIGVDVATLDQSRLPGFFTIYAHDAFGHFASSNGLVNFISKDTAPVFNRTSYGNNLPENTTVGTVVAVVSAVPGSNAGPLVYDWVIADSHFALNTTTGIITLVQPLDFSDSASFYLQVKATDSTGQYQVVDVRFNVTYVPKPPTNIVLSTNQFDEKMPAGSIVATISSVDPGSVSWTYTISPRTAPFYVVGDTLRSNVSFDYEIGPLSYTFNLTSRDETGLLFTKAVTVSIVNVIEAPTNVRVCPLAGCGAAFVVPDDTRVGEVIGVIQYNNPDRVPVTCRVFPNASFGVVLANGNYSVTLRQALDFVVASTVYLFPVCSVDNGRGAILNGEGQSTITVQNMPNPPKPPVLVLNPVLGGGLTEGTTNVSVGTVTSVNPDPLATNMTFVVSTPGFSAGEPTCTTVSGVVSCTVSVSVTGNITGVIYNSSGYGYVPVTVRVTDLGSGKFTDTVINVPVKFVNSAPGSPVWAVGGSVEEGSPAGTEVGVLELRPLYDFVTERATIVGSNSPVYLQELTASRRAAAGPGAVTRLSVRLSSGGLSYLTTQSLSFAVNVSNSVANGIAPGMWAVHTLTIAVSHKPMVAALVVGTPAVVVKSNGTVDVAERTPGFSVVAGIVVENMERTDLDATFELVDNGQGYFGVSGSNLVTSGQFLEFANVQFLNIAIKTTLSLKAGATSTVPFVATTVSYFKVAVQPVTALPTLRFVENGLSSYNVSVMIDALANVQVVGRFQIVGRQNSLMRATLSNDACGLFDVEYEAASDSFKITLVRTPSTCNSAQVGYYGDVVITVPDASGAITGLLNVTLERRLLVIGGDGPIFDESKSSSGFGGSALAGTIVGVVVGLIVLALLVALIVVRRRKQALDLKIANEPFYNQVGAGSLNNPTYLEQGGASALGFEPGIQNPMYAWYRPDLSRQESEEFLADQVDGAFVIRDSAATPGWHMLAVKTHNAIIHEKIKMSDDGLYELLPNASNGQPRFKEMPLLVEHYAEQQAGIRYTLALDNPLYDNSHMAHKKHGHAVAGAWSYQADASAPAVPLKERELAAVQQIAGAEAGDEIYTNTEQAKTVISSA